LHEQQLLVFLSALNDDLPGKFILDHCNVTRFTSASEIDTDSRHPSAKLNAECGGNWITMLPKITP
jgi:hypothetical protein